MRVATMLAILAFALTACGGGAGAPAQPAPQTAPKAAEPAAAPAKAAAPAAAPAKPAQPAAAPAKPAESASGQAPSAAQFTFRVGWVTPDDGMQGVMAHGFKDSVEKNSNGRIKINLFCCGQLGGELEQVAAVKKGDLDMHSGAATTVGSLTPAVLISLLPFFYPDRATAWKVLDAEAGQMALQALDRQGVKGLAWGENGVHGLINHRKAVNTVDDVKGMKIRVVETPIFVAGWRALGASPVPMAYPEVYAALQQKTVDGADGPYVSLVGAKFHEVAKYLALTNNTYNGSIFIVNLAKFNALPADLQKVVQDAAKAGALESRKAAQKADEAAIETMRKQGSTITTPPQQQFQAATKSVYDEFVPKIGEDIVAKARATMGVR